MNGFRTGEDVIIGGLFVQLIGFSVFLFVSALFHRRILRDPTPASTSVSVPWQRFLLVLYAVSALILIRSVFRAIEYILGYDSPLQNAEYWLYIFDAALMLTCTLLLNIFHPSKIISAQPRQKPAAVDSVTDSEMELQRPQQSDVGAAGKHQVLMTQRDQV
jgi:RTA1 like protein